MSKVAVVTGATDGIGRATASLLVQRGWRVGVLGRTPERVERVIADLTSQRADAAFPIVADLTSLDATRDAVSAISSTVDRLDLLLLNANHITQEHRVTPEGFEANVAIGWLSRVVMTRGLEPLLAASGGQIVSVVGLNLDRVDGHDLSLPGSPGGMKALGQWQWALQLYTRAWNTHSVVKANTFMPGIVKTKILDDEPGRLQRLAVKTAMLVAASTPEKTAETLLDAVGQVDRGELRDHYFSRSKDKGIRTLKATNGDVARVWDLSTSATQPWAT